MMFHGGHGPGPAQEAVKPIETGKAMRRLLRYFRPYWIGLALLLALALTGTLLQLAEPYLTGVAVDQFLQFPAATPRPTWLNWLLLILSPVEGPPGADRSTGLTVTMILLLVSYLLAQVAQGVQLYLMNVIGQRVLLTMRTQIFERIQTLSLKFFDKHEAGDLMSRLVNDTQVISQVFSMGLVRTLSITMRLVGIAIAMVALNWRLALASFTILPFILLTTVIFSQRARAAFRRSRETLGDVSAELEENIAGVREVQAFSREDETAAEFRRVNVANRDAFVTAQTIASAFSPALNILSTIALAIVAGYGGYLVLAFDPPLVSVGIIVSFLAYVRRFYNPIRQLSNLYARLQEALAGAERVFELLDTEPEVVNAPDSIKLLPIEGHIVFDHVHFAYKENEVVLQDINLEALPGQTVALVGPTGAGKTTIVNLLARLYDVDQGAVCIDGYDVRGVTQESLRQQMGIVLQDTFLFSGTVMENIRYGRLEADDEEVVAAARLANADQFITHLPEGYQTPLGERGHNLSQGQRQLIAIARAVLADPRILILDEATSSVDTRTELLIQRALDKLLRGRTSFVIAHRLSTIRNADQVFVVDQGRIIEQGTHEELLAARGLYCELYESQFQRIGVHLEDAV
ncbi:MAG: ABC transporter ATP-binding protein [Chloroflexota bacterium]|nr:ABC transporter ATP-binding protein [Chloroflexota bacterium]